VIEKIVADVFPSGTRLVSKLPPDIYKAAIPSWLNFTGLYPSGEKALYKWMHVGLLDMPQTGDSCGFTRYFPDRRQVRFALFPYEQWDVEMTDDGEEPLFYRFEYRYRRSDGKVHWRRWDVFKDHITRYAEKQEPGLDTEGRPPSDHMPTATSYALPALMPPELSALPREVYANEEAIIRRLNQWLAVPLIWRQTESDALRGLPELMLNDLAATDDINRLLTAWKDSAINNGDPPLAIIDGDLPPEQGGESHKLTKEDFGHGAATMVESTGDHQAQVTYPSNLPTIFPHADVLEKMRNAVVGNTPMASIDPTRIDRFADMSGFAKDMLEQVHLERVAWLRQNVVDDGFARLLKTGLELLALQGIVEGLTPEMARDCDLHFEYGHPPISPDEELKRTTTASMLSKLGVPAADVANILPLKSLDHEALVAALEKARQEADMVAEMQAAFKGPTIRGAQPKGTAGADKRGQ
jgi:hypothetical protein